MTVFDHRRRALLADVQCQAYIVVDLARLMPKEIDHTSLYYLTGSTGEGVLITTAKETVLLADERYFQAAKDHFDRTEFAAHSAISGHCIGLDLHERPFILADDPFELQPGMVTTMEPGIYIQGYGGVRIEDDVLITPTGPKVLNRFPKELMVVG